MVFEEGKKAAIEEEKRENVDLNVESRINLDAVRGMVRGCGVVGLRMH